MNDICKRLFATVQALAPKTEYEEFYKVVEKRVLGYESRILKDIKDGITIETLNTKKQRKAPEEKTAVAKQKKQQKRAKRKKEARDNLTKEEILQDDRFFFIAGYTSGGAPYGVTWEEMGLKLFDSLSVWQNVAFGLIENQNMPKKQAKNEAIRVLRQVGLAPDVADLSPSELSGGMQKRVGLARAIATKPEIIFFDEPTTGLDPIMSDVINDLIIKSVKGLGATALTITHDMASARKIADKIAMLYKGKIIWQGTVKEMDKTDNPYVRQFINGCSQGPIKVEV